jgi:hypothetical protein
MGLLCHRPGHRPAALLRHPLRVQAGRLRVLGNTARRHCPTGHHHHNRPLTPRPANSGAQAGPHPSLTTNPQRAPQQPSGGTTSLRRTPLAHPPTDVDLTCLGVQSGSRPHPARAHLTLRVFLADLDDLIFQVPL